MPSRHSHLVECSFLSDSNSEYKRVEYEAITDKRSQPKRSRDLVRGQLWRARRALYRVEVWLTEILATALGSHIAELLDHFEVASVICNK